MWLSTCVRVALTPDQSKILAQALGVPVLSVGRLKAWAWDVIQRELASLEAKL